MASTPPITKLVQLAEHEGSFRKQSLGYLMSLVKGPQVPANLKVLAILTLAIFVLFSFQFCILILHLVGAAFNLTPKVQPVYYGCLFGGEWLSGMALAVPLIPRLGSYGESKRLEENLSTIAEKKAARRRAPRIANGP